MRPQNSGSVWSTASNKPLTSEGEEMLPHVNT